MRKINLVNDKGNVHLREAMYLNGEYARRSDGEHILAVVDSLLAARGMEIVYSDSPENDGEILIILDARE